MSSAVSNKKINTLIIVGEPLSGWVAATMLAVMLRPLNIQITLLTSTRCNSASSDNQYNSQYNNNYDNNPIVSSNCFLNQLNLLSILGVSLPEFVQRCQASFRVGDRYVGDRYVNDQHSAAASETSAPVDFIQSLSGSGFSFGAVSLTEFLARSNRSGDASQVGDYSFAAQLAQLKKFIGLDNGECSKSDLSNIGVNFLRAEFIALFETHKNRLLVEHIDVDALCPAGLNDLQVMHDLDGSILALQLGTRNFAADMFIDCTGHSRRLIGQFSETVPLAQVWSEFINPQDCPFTFAPDMPATQYFIASHSVVKAVFLPGKAQLQCFYTSTNAVTTCAQLKSFYRTREPWAKNCIALGNASADIGNFSVNELDLIQQTIPLFIEHFPRGGVMSILAQQFNSILNEQLDGYWNFNWLLLNSYQLQQACLTENETASESETDRGATIFSPSLQQRLAIYRASARILIGDYEALSEQYWASFLLGWRWVPQSWSTACDLLDMAQATASLRAEQQALSHRLQGLKPYSQVMQLLACGPIISVRK